MKSLATIIIINIVLFTVAALADSKLRPHGIPDTAAAPPIQDHEVAPMRRQRDYPMVAPTIPHSTQGFVITKDFNQCMMCHEADKAPMLKAPSIGESHYLNRDGEYMSDVSARRYFCTQCHVPQHMDQPAVANSF